MQGNGWRVKLSAAFFRRNPPKEPPAMISRLKRLRGTLNAANSARQNYGPQTTPRSGRAPLRRFRAARALTPGKRKNRGLCHSRMRSARF